MRHKILFVEDDDTSLKGMKLLAERKYQVLVAGTGEEGVELLRGEEIHVIVSDQKLPGMDGVSFLAHAQYLRPSAVRVLMTGYTDLNAIIGAVNQGRIFHYLHKPFTGPQLFEVLEAASKAYDSNAISRAQVEDTLQVVNSQLEATRQILEQMRSGIASSSSR